MTHHHAPARLLCLSLQGLPPQEADIWIDVLRSGWRSHPKAVPLQMVGMALMALLISKSSLPMAQWLPLWTCMILISLSVIPLAFRFRRQRLEAGNYQAWRALLLGWRAMHGVSGGVLCALLYGALTPQWQLPLLTTVVVFCYGLTFYAIEDFGLAMVGTAPIVLCLLAALLIHGQQADHYIAVLLGAAIINGWLAGRAISRRLFEAARMRQRNVVLVGELAREVDEVTRAKAEADHANREKSEFFASASHDLRQPLYSLQLLSDHLREQLTTLAQTEVADKLGAALGSMRQLFERMFDVARIEAQKVSYRPQPVSVRELFVALDHEFALVCREKGLRWAVQPTEDWIWTDPVLAQRMLRNLLENAVRYTTQGEVRLRARRRGLQVHCQVWDTGMGIARADQGKVFNDYFQVQNTARRAQDGLGLGLGVVRRLLSLTDTRISLRSRLGRGSCFGIAFQMGPPRLKGARQASVDNLAMPCGMAASSPNIQGNDRPCVLVLEDQANVLDAVTTVLRDSGYLPLGGDKAMPLLAQAAERAVYPCAVVCDYRLGHGYTGFDAIAELRHEMGDELPAILVTGDLDPKIEAEAARLDIKVMHKPVDRAQLLGALGALFESTRAGG
jgi:signal transduction histidine kinase